MKNNFLTIFTLISFSLFSQKQVLCIIPEPVSVEYKSSFFNLNSKTTVGYNSLSSKKLIESFISKIKTSTSYNISTAIMHEASIQFIINDIADPKIGDEGYLLNVSENDIKISANQTAGLFYGTQTLLQLFPKEIESKTPVITDWKIPAVTITDYPRFKWRGIMLDVSRHFFTKEEVKSYIDQIAKYKYNIFHWHLTDDNGWRIEIKSLPKLTQVGAWRVERFGRFGSRAEPKPGEATTSGGFYTHDDIREIIVYAAERNVEIIPEIDVPGHCMAVLASYPELSCTKDSAIKVNPGTKFSEWYANGKFKMLVDNTLNPSDERVYDFLDKLFSEVASLFPTPFIHVGGDECYKGYWKENTDCQQLMKKMKLNDVEQLQGYFMARVDEILKRKGKKLLGWDEILEDGLSSGATIMSWRGVKWGIEAAKRGFNVVMSPTTFAYLDYYQGEKSIEPPVYEGLRVKKAYSFEPVPEGVDSKYILGGQGNLWTEQVATLRHAQYMTYPRAWALSEVFWSLKKNKEWDTFTLKMESHFQRADLAEVNYSKAIYDPIITCSKENESIRVNIEPEIKNLDIYYSLDDSMPDEYSLQYKDSFLLPSGPVTLRVITFRDHKPIGHLITLSRDMLDKRAK